MINTPEDLYRAVLACKPGVESSICLLHKPCKAHPLCSTTSTTEVLDFDAVEKELARGKRSNQPSCDGVTLNPERTIFCFLEIKGWREFVKRNINVPDSNLSADDKKKIENKADSYNLKGKLEQSMDDCKEIANDSDLFLKFPFIYIIVTDIENEKSAAEDIAANLSLLAETASVWTYCDKSMKKRMDTLGDAVMKVYTHCRDFDTCIAGIHEHIIISRFWILVSPLTIL